MMYVIEDHDLKLEVKQACEIKRLFKVNIQKVSEKMLISDREIKKMHSSSSISLTKTMILPRCLLLKSMYSTTRKGRR